MIPSKRTRVNQHDSLRSPIVTAVRLFATHRIPYPTLPRQPHVRTSESGQVNAAACLNRGEIAEIGANFTQRQDEVALRDRSKEAASQAAGAGTGTEPWARNAVATGDKPGRPRLVKPPQLPVEDPTALGGRDEEDISLLEEFFVKVFVSSYAFRCGGV